MGIDFSFQVYVHQRDAGRLLTAVAALCDSGGDRWTTVALLDGTSIVLPGGYGFGAGRTVELANVVAGPDRSAFDLTLCFPQDGPLRGYRYGQTHGFQVARAWPNGTTRVAVGYVYLSVFEGSSLLPEHWRFDFTPASSPQSRLFLLSAAIRDAFATLALSAGAPLCLLDVEEDYKIVVTVQDRRVSAQVPGPCALWHDRARRPGVSRTRGSAGWAADGDDAEMGDRPGTRELPAFREQPHPPFASDRCRSLIPRPATAPTELGRPRANLAARTPTTPGCRTRPSAANPPGSG